jgi:hypothetical protein
MSIILTALAIGIVAGLVIARLESSRRVNESATRSIAQILNDGINSVEDLQESLQAAIRLEFSTLPPYLSAEWSIKDQSDAVRAIIHQIVIQEMLHMALACNMLTAIGGKPRLTAPGFVPQYPTDGLPGGVHPGLKVDLQPLSNDTLKTFMAMEYPDHAPVALSGGSFATIGQFYAAIGEAFIRLKPQFTGKHQVVHSMGDDSIFAINSLDDALKAIAIITQQGEGTVSTPEIPDFDPDQIAHYYAFKQILAGRRLQRGADGQWRFDGPEVPMPAVWNFSAASTPTDEFNRTLAALLLRLEQAWTEDAHLMDAMRTMFDLRKQGIALIKQGIRPDFRA